MESTLVHGGRQIAPAESALIAQGHFRASPDEISGLRKAPDPSGRFAVHPSLLRHADEQTVVGLAAVFDAIRTGGLGPIEFDRWAVLVAPRYLGRTAFERAFPTFRDEGAWGVSPHLIPAHSLHSPSGTISQALKAQGPNLGVGGTPGGEGEAFLFAATLLLTGPTPGVWVVLTGRVAEVDGQNPAGDYEALALALTPIAAGSEGPRLLIAPDAIRLDAASGADDPALARWLDPGLLRLDDARTAGAVPRPHFRPNPTPADRETRQ